MSLMDAKMQYIRSWQALVDFGITYFIVRLARMRKDVSTIIKDSRHNLYTVTVSWSGGVGDSVQPFGAV